MRLQKSMILDLTERRCPSQESSFRIQFFLFEFNYLNVYISFDCSLFITFLWLHFMLSPYLQCSPLTPFVNYTLALSVKDTMVLTFLSFHDILGTCGPRQRQRQRELPMATCCGKAKFLYWVMRTILFMPVSINTQDVRGGTRRSQVAALASWTGEATKMPYALTTTWLI